MTLPFDTVDCATAGCDGEADGDDGLCRPCRRRARQRPARRPARKGRAVPTSLQHDLHDAITLLNQARGPYLHARGLYAEALANYQACRDRHDRAALTGVEEIDHPDGLDELQKRLAKPPPHPVLPT